MSNYVTLPPISVSSFSSQEPVRLTGEFERAKPTEFIVPGKSAYEIAVNSGFIGTQAEWIASLSNASMLGIGYWMIKANSSTTFPPRSSIPSWWTKSVQYDSTFYLSHSDPTDMIVGDQHFKRTT